MFHLRVMPQGTDIFPGTAKVDLCPQIIVHISPCKNTFSIIHFGILLKMQHFYFSTGFLSLQLSFQFLSAQQKTVNWPTFLFLDSIWEMIFTPHPISFFASLSHTLSHTHTHLCTHTSLSTLTHLSYSHTPFSHCDILMKIFLDDVFIQPS